MAEQIGYVSSFLESEGLGFIRCADDPQRLVLFHRAVVADDVVDEIIEGLEVAFEVAPTADPAHAADAWPVVSVVKAHIPSPAEVSPSAP
jgi:cold shock CspA family protein